MSQGSIRIRGATCADVRRALWEDRGLVKTYGPRGTVHLLATRDLAMWAGALSAIPAQSPFPEGVRLTPDQSKPYSLITLALLIGLWLALLLNNHLPFKSLLRAIILLPWIVPEIVTAVALLVEMVLIVGAVAFGLGRLQPLVDDPDTSANRPALEIFDPGKSGFDYDALLAHIEAVFPIDDEPRSVVRALVSAVRVVMQDPGQRRFQIAEGDRTVGLRDHRPQRVLDLRRIREEVVDTIRRWEPRVTVEE